MTQEVLTALGASAPAGAGEQSAQTEGLSFRTSPQTGVGIRSPREETEGTDCHGQCVHWPRNDRGEGTPRSAQTEGLSFRTSPQTGVGIRSPREEKEGTDCHGQCDHWPRNDGETPETKYSAFRIPNSELSPHSEFRIPNSELSPHSEFRIPNSEFLRAHFAALCAQGEALRQEDPSFDLDAALRDPDFLRLTAPGLGVDVRRAWTALHPELLQRRAAADAGGMLARSLSSAAARPREGGGQAGGSLDTDYRRLPRAEQLRLKQRIYNAAALGEKIYP